jgi:signal peptidase I
MSDRDQNPAEEALAAVPPQVEAPPAQVAAEPQTVEPDVALPESSPPAAPEHKGHREPKDLFGIQAFFTVVIFSIYVITFIVQAFQIPSGSMENTLLIGDFLLVDKLHYAGLPGSAHLLPYGKIERGDIVVFYFPVVPSVFLG